MTVTKTSPRGAPRRSATPRAALQGPASQRIATHSTGSITISDYFAVVGSNLTDEEAKIAGPEIFRLNGDRDAILAAAQDPKNPLHNLSWWDGWDKDAAALSHWRTLAGQLAASIEAEIVYPDGKTSRTRAFVALYDAEPVTSSASGRRLKTFMPVTVVSESSDLRLQWLQDAMRDLRAFRNRYREIEDLLGRIPLAIDEALAEFEDAA